MARTILSSGRKRGHSYTPEYRIWWGFICRCTKPNHPRYADYGGRGIKVCDRWLKSFAAFYADMGERPAGLSLDRIDNDGPYSPENCRWTTTTEQRRNNRHIRPLTVNGETMLLVDWAKRVGIDPSRITDRIKEGWTVEDAVTTPVRIQGERAKRFRSEQPEYIAWRNAINRCRNRSNRKFKDYGGRGVRFCKRWLKSFENFLADMGKRPSPDHSLDRIDVDGDYTPENCRWATREVQANNKRRKAG